MLILLICGRRSLDENIGAKSWRMELVDAAAAHAGPRVESCK
jgi:hypothetical protein